MNRVQAVGPEKFGIVAIEMTGTSHQTQVERLVVLSLLECHAPAQVDVNQMAAVDSSRSRRAGNTTFTLSEEGYFVSVPVQPGYAVL